MSPTGDRALRHLKGTQGTGPGSSVMQAQAVLASSSLAPLPRTS